ncbi:FadR/GntR family transcriptional regulator [Actinophytocola sp.]|uniref:FadR/GntR family transcriptional regulator n=1 Tax=Actinophytocola sp. TaxID=1872138 RepID=UPI002ED352DA
MALQPVARRSVPDEVFDQIIDDVVSGEFAPGESLPSERKLAEVLGVSRPAVREALQRVAQAGLVEVRQGDATTVRDFRRHASLDLLPRLLLPRGELDPGVARSVLEARLLIGPKVAALAAERAGARIGGALRESVTALEVDDDPVARQRHALVFWDHIVDGADSIVFRLMFNSLRASYEPALAALAHMMEAEVGQFEVYRALADAIVAGNAEGARRAAEDLLAPATNALLDAIKRLEEMS